MLLFRSVLVKFGLSRQALKGRGKGLEALPHFKGSLKDWEETRQWKREHWVVSPRAFWRVFSCSPWCLSRTHGRGQEGEELPEAGVAGVFQLRACRRARHRAIQDPRAQVQTSARHVHP